LENLTKHKRITISKHSRLGKLLGVKKTIAYCETCKEEWPCYYFERELEDVEDNFDMLILAYQQLREAFDTLSINHLRALHAVGQSLTALQGLAADTNIDQENEVDS
jgi:hypothetical protein